MKAKAGVKEPNQERGYAALYWASTLQRQVNRKFYTESKLPNPGESGWICSLYGYFSPSEASVPRVFSAVDRPEWGRSPEEAIE